MKRIFKNKSTTITKKLFLLCAFFFGACFFSPALTKANSFSPRTSSFVPLTSVSDSTKAKYDLNDPRNPNCPCHKYQKLAEDEYKRLQEKEKLKAEKKEIGKKENNAANTISKTKNHRKKLLFRFKTMGGSHGREKKQKSILSCFHWH